MAGIIDTREFDGVRGNMNIKRKGEKIEFTPEMIEEWKRCAEDPIYFSENYIKIVSLDHGLIPIKLYEYQKDIINAITFNRRVTVNTSRQAGKCVCINTPIKIRNKTTGEVVEMTIGEFYELQQKQGKDASQKT